jgi:hypothetical protein
LGLTGLLATLFISKVSIAIQAIAQSLFPLTKEVAFFQITKEEFRSKLQEIRRDNKLSTMEDHKNLREAIIQAFGKPSNTQTIAGQSFWYWQCQDGIIQMKVFTDFGYFHVQAVNDY